MLLDTRSTASAPLLTARWISSSDGDRRTLGTASWTSTSKNGRSRNRNPDPAREQMRFFNDMSELRVQFRSAAYIMRL